MIILKKVQNVVNWYHDLDPNSSSIDFSIVTRKLLVIIWRLTNIEKYEHIIQRTNKMKQ